jgi:hypothetical protein
MNVNHHRDGSVRALTVPQRGQSERLGVTDLVRVQTTEEAVDILTEDYG